MTEAPPKKETVSEAEFKAEEVERAKRYDAVLAGIKCVSFVSFARFSLAALAANAGRRLAECTRRVWLFLRVLLHHTYSTCASETW